MQNFNRKLVVGAIFDFHGFQKGTFWITFSVTAAPKCTGKSWEEPPCRDPAFHETRVITVPLGHRGFNKYIFSMEIGSFSVFVAFRGAMFYTICSSLVFIKHR